ncbi:MAG: HAD-IB family phosphatase [Desulfurococcales archaeon]|nr:HAD-IB family phosphatase [Desulfurococcales archaeon]
MRRIKIVFFDVDGVLTTVRSSWEYVHRRLGVLEEAKRGVRLFEEGLIDYEGWMRYDTSLWIKAAGGRLHRSLLYSILSEIPIRSGARELVSWLHKHGVIVALVSAGVDLLVQRVAAEIGADVYVSPRLRWDKRGYLIAGGHPLITPTGKRGKAWALKRIAGEYGVSLNEAVYVGDSRWDKEAMSVVAYPIAFGDECPELDEVALCRVRSMPELREAIELIEKGACTKKGVG